MLNITHSSTFPIEQNTSKIMIYTSCWLTIYFILGYYNTLFTRRILRTKRCQLSQSPLVGGTGSMAPVIERTGPSGTGDRNPTKEELECRTMRHRTGVEVGRGTRSNWDRTPVGQGMGYPGVEKGTGPLWDTCGCLVGQGTEPQWDKGRDTIARDTWDRGRGTKRGSSCF